MEPTQIPHVSSAYASQTSQQRRNPFRKDKDESPQPSSNNIFFESEVKKGSEIVIHSSQPSSVSTTDITSREEQMQQGNQRQNVFYSTSSLPENVIPKTEPQYDNSADITSTQPDSSFSDISSPSQVGSISSSSLLKMTQEQAAGFLSEGLPKPMQSDKTHICLTCCKAFRNKPQLTQHELVHNGIRKHVCSYCDKAFKQICHLNQHIRVHTGDRPYKCNMEGCGRAFAQLSNLNHHQKNHEEHVRRDISRQYRCEICDRSYANHNSLQTHIMKLHANVKAENDPLIQALSSPTTKKRKKSTQSTETASSPQYTPVSETSETFLVDFAEAEADGLPSQVRTKPSLQTKSSKPTVYIPTSSNPQKSGLGTVVSKESKSLPVPYQNNPLSSIVEKFHQDSPKPHEGRLQIEQTRQSPSMSEHATPVERSIPIETMSEIQFTHRELAQIQSQQQRLHDFSPLSSRETIQCSTSNTSNSNLPSALQLISQQSSLLHQRNQVLEDRSRASVPQGQEQGQLRLPLSLEGPSHLTHHFPDPNSGNKQVSRPQVFNPAFSDQRDRYSQSQF